MFKKLNSPTKCIMKQIAVCFISLHLWFLLLRGNCFLFFFLFLLLLVFASILVKDVKFWFCHFRHYLLTSISDAVSALPESQTFPCTLLSSLPAARVRISIPEGFGALLSHTTGRQSSKWECRLPNPQQSSTNDSQGLMCKYSSCPLSGRVLLKPVFCLISQSIPSGMNFLSPTVLSDVIPHSLLVVFSLLYHFPSSLWVSPALPN